jgi:hypothetical protein
MVGLDGIEPSTSRLSGVRSNQLSYRPKAVWRLCAMNVEYDVCLAICFVIDLVISGSGQARDRRLKDPLKS